MDDVIINTGPDQPADTKVPPTKKKRRIVIYILVLTALVLLAIPYWYTSNPQSCTRCHEMEPYYKSWQDSFHSTAAKNCLECHVKEGALNLALYRISFYREIYASFTGAKLKPIGSTLPGVESCQKHGCHSLNRDISASGDIKINHRNHISKAELACTKCHPGVVHPNVGNIGAALPARSTCKSCHQAMMDRCSFCHIKQQLDQTHKH